MSTGPAIRVGSRSVISLSTECHVERGPGFRLGLGPHPAPMLLGNPLHHGQTCAVAFEFIGPVKALEHAEQFSCIRHLESHAVVLYTQSSLPIYFQRADPNHG